MQVVSVRIAFFAAFDRGSDHAVESIFICGLLLALLILVSMAPSVLFFLLCPLLLFLWLAAIFGDTTVDNSVSVALLVTTAVLVGPRSALFDCDSLDLWLWRWLSFAVVWTALRDIAALLMRAFILLSASCRRLSIGVDKLVLLPSSGNHSISLLVDCAVNGIEIRLQELGRIANHFHISANLRRDLLQDFLSQITPGYSLLKSHKLDDIPLGFLIFIVFEHFVVRVELDHLLKIFIAHAYYDYGAWQFTGLDDHSLSFHHIMNITICQNQKDKVGHKISALHCKVHKYVHDTGEESRTCHVDPSHIFLVHLQYPINTSDFRLVKPAIKREAVISLSFIHEPWNTSKAETWEIFELIVGL